MVTLIASILIVYVFWLVIKPWMARYARRKMEQRVRDMFRDQFGVDMDPDHGEDHSSDTRSYNPFESFFGRHADDGDAGRRRDGKKIPRDMGEYVEFVEIDIPMPPPPPRATPRASRRSLTPSGKRFRDIWMSRIDNRAIFRAGFALIL